MREMVLDKEEAVNAAQPEIVSKVSVNFYRKNIWKKIKKMRTQQVKYH